MSRAKVEAYEAMLAMAFEQTKQIAGTIPEANRCLQIEPGRVQPTWLLGHLANTTNVVVHCWMFGGESLFPKQWGKTFAPDFAGGNPVTPNAADYPPWDDVVAGYDRSTTQTLQDLSGLDDSKLGEPLPVELPERLKSRFSNYEAALRMMVLHDNYHRGQLGLLSKLTRTY